MRSLILVVAALMVAAAAQATPGVWESKGALGEGIHTRLLKVRVRYYLSRSKFESIQSLVSFKLPSSLSVYGCGINAFVP